MIQQRWTRVFAPLVWFALAQILVVTLLGSSPAMHQCFHLDAHDADHHCLVTDFQSGWIDHAVVVPVVTPSCSTVGGEIGGGGAGAGHSLPLHLCGSLLEHGPPSRA